MNNLGHGANVDEMAKRYNIDVDKIIDFSSNINPYIINDLGRYINEGLNECKKYPDINYEKLRSNISKYTGVKKEFIIPGNGATEIIYLLMKSINGPLAIMNPTFSEYERGAKLNDIKIKDLYFDSNFEVNLKNIKESINEFECLFVCNPNNPTGKVQQIEELLKLLKEEDKLLIVDETFMEFVQEEDKYSLVKYVEEYPNLIIIKAVTKFFGIPGIRLGYGLSSNKELMKSMYLYKEPWTINTFADILSNYIFEDKKYIKESKTYFIEEIKYMEKELSTIKGLKVYNTDTNFILLKLENEDANSLKQKVFVDSNILIRDASNFKGLDKSFIRIAIKSHEENEVIIKSLKEILGDK